MEILDSDSVVNEDPSLPGCCDVWPRKYLPVFRKGILPPFSGFSSPRTCFLVLLDPEDGNSTQFRNVGNCLHVDVVQRTRRLVSLPT